MKRKIMRYVRVSLACGVVFAIVIHVLIGNAEAYSDLTKFVALFAAVAALSVIDALEYGPRAHHHEILAAVVSAAEATYASKRVGTSPEWHDLSNQERWHIIGALVDREVTRAEAAGKGKQ